MGGVAMWGIRALRVCAVLALLATAGCCERCQSLWKGDTKAAPPAQEKEEPAPNFKTWKRSPADWGFKDQVIPAENVHGGIY